MSTGYPKTSINIVSATTDVSNSEQKILFIGQKVSSGTATSSTLITDIQNDKSWDTLFGSNSMLAGMIRVARSINTVNRIDAIALDDDGSATAATATIDLAGTATASGTIVFDIVSSKDYRFSLPVATNDTGTALASALVNLINANANIPVTASSSTTTVTLTADNKGTEANSFALSYSGSVDGIVTTLTGFTGGATDPSTTGITDLIGNNRYQAIVSPYAYGTSYLTDFLDPRFNVTNNILDGVAFVTQTDTVANIKTFANTQNSNSLVILSHISANNDDLKGSIYVEAPYNISAYFAAIRAFRLTDGTDISDLVTTTSALDTLGGVATASLPYFNTPFSQLLPCDQSLSLTDTEIEELTDSGASVFQNNVTNSDVIFGQMVTTYKTDATGNDDISFKYLNYVDTSSNAREYQFNNVKKDFSQSRLTNSSSGLVPYRSIANADLIESAFMGYYSTLSSDSYVLTRAGQEPTKFYRDNLSITIDLSTGTATVLQKVPLVTQLRNIVSTFQIQFNI